MRQIVRNGVGAPVSPIAKTAVLATVRGLVMKKQRNSSARSPVTGKRSLEVSVHLFQRKGNGGFRLLGKHQGNLSNFREHVVCYPNMS